LRRIGILTLAIGLAFLIESAWAGWTAPQRLSWTSGISESPVLAIDSQGHLHAAWTDDTTGHFEVYYEKSTNGGAAWTAKKRLTSASATYASVDIAVDTADNIHIVWGDNQSSEVYYKKSTDGGGTWTASKRLTWNSGSSSDPAISVDSLGNIHVVWEETAPGNQEVYYKRSTDGGLTWTASRRLTWSAEPSWYPDIASHWSGWLYVVWEDLEKWSYYKIYFRRGTIGGTAWSATQKVTWSSGNSYIPALAVDFSGVLHLVWHGDTPGNLEIYYRNSTDGGASWSAAQRITWNSSQSYNPNLSVDSSGNPYVIWTDGLPGQAGEIYYRMSSDGGVSWAPTQRLTWNSGYSHDPVIAIDPSGKPHVLWWDDTPGNFEIYYMRSQ